AVAAVRRVELAGAVTDASGGATDQVRDTHPEAADGTDRQRAAGVLARRGARAVAGRCLAPGRGLRLRGGAGTGPVARGRARARGARRAAPWSAPARGGRTGRHGREATTSDTLRCRPPRQPRPSLRGRNHPVRPPAGHPDWRVTWSTAASAAGPVLTATGFASRPRGAGLWSDEGAKAWELRWSTPPLHSDQFGTLLPEQTLEGPLALLSRQRTLARF